MTLWAIILFLVLLPGGVGYTIGRSRDQGAAGLVLGLLLSWLGVIICLLLPSGGVRCPMCAERVRRDARVCFHCGADVTGVGRDANVAVRDFMRGE